MRLNQLQDNDGANKPRKRVGRGIGSGTGKTAGRGVKGQKSRSGVAIKGYEGGQMPIYIRLPKRGFNSRNKKRFALVNLGRLQSAVEAGKLQAGSAVDVQALIAATLVSHPRDGVRLLAKGELKTALEISVTGASKAAVEAVEKAGGKVHIVAKPAEASAE
ncbi:MAG: 50S ribosomal protein L15 [Proteobacteria bacterium]|nr:50S ribosomal protein L15 [Pseudomonadota bacterium]